MQPHQPYAPPQAYGHQAYAQPGYSPYAAQAPATSGGGVSPTVLEHLRRTKPWVTFFGVMMFICSAIMVLAALAMIGFAAVGSQLPGMNAAVGAGMGVAYLLLSLIYIAPALFLLRYGSSIRRLLDSNSVTELETALGHQTSFWRFTGIFAAVMLCLYAVVIVIVVIAGAAGAMAAL